MEREENIHLFVGNIAKVILSTPRILKQDGQNMNKKQSKTTRKCG